MTTVSPFYMEGHLKGSQTIVIYAKETNRKHYSFWYSITNYKYAWIGEMKRGEEKREKGKN